MKITVEKIIGKEWLDRACSMTVDKAVSPNLYKMYKSEHSPIRTQVFWVEMIEIQTFVSVHFTRHKTGVEHFVKSNRDDRSCYSGEDLGRHHPVNHAMFINAQALINIARKRLCNKAHAETRRVMESIVDELQKADPDLTPFLVPDCMYRDGCCEPNPCGENQ